MHLSQLLSLILAKTPLTISIPDNDNIQLDTPADLSSVEILYLISDIVADACRKEGLSERGSLGFGDFVAKLCTGLSAHYRNETTVSVLEASFGQAAYGGSGRIVRLDLLPKWSVLNERLPAIQRGLAAAFEVAKSL
jgi:hypothetical protein